MNNPCERRGNNSENNVLGGEEEKMNAIFTVSLLAIVLTSHPATSEENTGPSLNHLLITSSADIYLSSSTPNCIHLLTSTWIDSTIRLTSKDVTVIGSEQTIITTVSRNQLADNHRNQCDSDSSANCASSSVFSIQNTTLSLASLTFDLISGPQNQDSWYVCSLSWNSHVLAKSVTFHVDAAVSPFKLVPSTFGSESACSLTVSLCMLKNSENLIGSFLEIDNALPPTESISMSLSSFHLDSQTLISNSGLSFSSSPSEYGLTNDCQIQSVVSDCQLFNLSSNPAHPTSRSFRWLRERIVGCEVRCVVKSLEGTVTTRLGKQSEFLIQNSSLLECVNEEVIETTKSYDSILEITSSAQRINHGSEFTHYAFRGCTIKATNMTTSFTLITLNPIAGNLEFVGCSFEVECDAQHITLISATAVRDNKVKCLIDTCTFKFWRETETSATYNQVMLYNFQEISVVSSTFSPPSSNFSSARAIYLSNPISFLFFSNTSFVRQTSNGNGGALYLPYSLIRFFHCHFEANKALNGGAFYTASCWHYLCSCTFTRNEATKWGGAIYSNYISRLRMFDCHFDNNQAFWKYENDQTKLAHYRGNDIFAFTSKSDGIDATTVFGCTSTSNTPKYGFYYDNLLNGVHPQDDILLPSPSGSTFSYVFSVEAGESGTCSEGDPCGSLSAALSQLSTDPSLINLGNGIFEEGSLDISKPVELRGLGFFVNTSTFTTLKTSCVVSGGGNVTLMSLSLKPTDSSSTIFAMQSTSQSFLSNVKIECISGHLAPLLSFSSGTSTVHSSWLSSIKMENHAAIEITGTATVTFQAAWFMEMTRVNGNGGSCIDSETSGVISFIQTNMAHCSSSGRAGCLDLIASSSTSQVVFSSILFTKNTGNTSLSLFGNDLAHTGFVPSKISSISNCRSLSTLPHILVNETSKSNLVCANRFFTPSGIDHPFATDFERGVPGSWFKGFQEEIDALMESSTEVLLRISDPQTFTPFEVTRKYIQIKSCSLTPQFYDRQLVFVGVSGYLRFTSTAMTFSNAPTVTPFVVAPTAVRLYFQTMPITLSGSQQNVPLIECNGGILQFDRVTFLTPSGLILNGCSLVECSVTSIEFLASSIENVTSDEDGAVFHATNCSFKSESSSFKKCRARNGGAVAIELSGSKTILITHESTSAFATSFSECVAVGDSSGGSNSLGRGGALFVSGTSTHSTPILFFSSSTNHARFEGNIADLGMDLFITSDLFKGKETISIDSFGGGSMSADDHVAIEDRPSSDSEWIGLLIPTPKVSVNGSITEIMTGKSGQDNESCKWTSTFCATLGYGIKHLTKKYSTGELFPQSIQFVWNMTYNETGVVVNNQDVSVSGTTAKTPSQAKVLRTIVEIVGSTTASSLFTIKNHSKLSVSGLDLRAIAKCGLFDLEADGDCLIVSDVGVVCSDGTEYSNALIKSSGRPVSIDSCTFNTSNGGPATLTHPLVQLVPPSADVVPSAAITLRSVSISSFKSTRMIVEIDTDGPISILNTLFSSCSCSAEMNGKVILVKTSKLDESITKERWSGSVVEGVEPSWFYGQDRSLPSTSGLFELSLLLMLGDGPSDTILVSSTTHCSPHINCGSSALPCSTFEASLRSSTNHSIDSIVLAQSSLLESPFVAESSLTIQSQTGKQVLALQSAAQFDVDDDSTVVLLSSLEMSIDPTCSSSPVFLVSNGELHLSSSKIGTDSLALLHSDVTTLIKVLGAGTLRLTDTLIQNLQFTHHKQGTTILLEKDATFVTDSSSIFDRIASNGTGSLIFVWSENLSETATTSPLVDFNSTIPLPTNALFSETEKNRFFGKEGSEEWSLLYFWHPHTSGSVHINTTGQDHPNCGNAHLPCSSIVESQCKLKGELKLMTLDTKSTLSSELVSTTSEWTLTQSSGGSLWIEEDGQLTISKSNPSKLTLSGMRMKFGTMKEGRTSAVMLIEEGWMILSLCEIGDELSEIGISVGRVCGGSLTIGGTTMNLVSSTTPLFSTESGSLIVEESCAITHPASPRTTPLLWISGGSASLTSTTIPAITLSSSNSLISVSGSGSLSVCDVDFDSIENSGSGAVLHFSSSGCLSLDGVNLNGSRCGSSGKGRSLFISRPNAFTLDNLHLRDVTVTQPTSIGTHEILIEGTSFESASCSDWKTFVGSDASSLTRSTIVENWFENKENSSLSYPIAYLIFGHSTGAVHINTDFWDHPNCGIEQLPCSSLLTAHNKLTEKDQTIILHSDVELSGVINAKSTGSEISSSSSSSPAKLTLTGDAQFNVPLSTSLTLTSLAVSLPTAVTNTIFLVTKGSLSLTSLNIQATDVSPSSTTPLFSVSSGSLILTNTNMLFGHLFELGSSSVIEQMGGKVEMTGCEIANISKVTGDGSVIHSTLTSATDSLLIDGCSFSSCSSGGKGGVIFVSCAAAVPSSNLIVRSTFDSACLCGSSEKGSWVFVEGRSLSSLITTSNWQTTITSLSTPTHDSLLWGADLSEQSSSDYRSVSLLAFLAEYNSNAISVGTGGKDVSGCGLTNRRCFGLDLAHSHLDGVGVHSLVVHSESSLASSISIATHDITISPFDGSTFVSVGASGRFVVRQSQLTLAQLVIQSDSKARLLSLLTISESGSADISKCSFSSFVLSSSALISHSAGTLELSSSNFSSISRNEGNGGVLESEMKEGMKLLVDSVLLKSVSVSNGLGDGLFVSFTSISSPSKIPEFTLTNMKYSLTTETNTVPRFVWIEGNDLSSWIVSNDPRVAGSYGVGLDEEWLWSVDKSEELSTSLVFYLKAGSGPIGIAESGRDHPRCGYFSLWCSSMSQAMSRGEEMGASQMNVMGSAEVSIGVDLWNEMRMKGKPLMSRVRMRKTGWFSEVGGDTVHFESLLFEIETEERTLSPFTVTSGHMNVSNVELKVIGSSKISLFKSLSSQLSLQMIRFSETTSKLGTIVECEGGIATISDIQLSSLSFSKTPFIASHFDSMHFKEIAAKSIWIDQLVSISNGSDFQMVGCTFEGPSQSPPSSSNDDEDDNKNDLCAWTTGAISLSDTTANVDGCRFFSVANGALFVQNSNVTIDACVFRDNAPHNTSFPSARRNLRCVDGEVRIGSLSGGDGFESPSLWMSSENCVVRRNETAVEAAHFIPSLDASKSSVVMNKNKSMTITLAGSLFIPCSLFLEVSETASSKLNKTPFVVSLTPSTTLSFSETEINLTLSHSELNKSLNVDSELSGCLVFGDGVRSSSFVLKKSLVDEKKAHGTAMMKWLLPLICGVVVLGLILVLVIVLLVRRRRNEKKKKSEGLLTNQELNEEEIVKEDFLPEHSLGTAAFVFEESDKDINLMKGETIEQREGKDICDDKMPSGPSFGEDVLIRMNEGVQASSAPKYVSLYEKLHGNGTSTMTEKQKIVFQIVKALKELAESQPAHAIFTRLSPHAILLNDKNELRFDVHNTMRGQEHFGKFTAEEASRRREDEQRWQAPETDEKNEGEVDGPAASVFSLGLLLAEVDTGQVPFGEVDGINAHRMAGTGTRPNMEGMNEDLESLILECLELNPSDRPDLSAVLATLNSIWEKSKHPHKTPDEVVQDVDGRGQRLNTDQKDTANNQFLFFA